MNNNSNNPSDVIQGLGEEAKLELLELLAEELGFDLAEQGEPVDPQSDIVEVVASAIHSLQEDLRVLQTQFAEGAELEYADLDGAAKDMESVIGALWEAHGNLTDVIDSEFEDDEEDEDEDEDEDDDEDEDEDDEDEEKEPGQS